MRSLNIFQRKCRLFFILVTVLLTGELSYMFGYQSSKNFSPSKETVPYALDKKKSIGLISTAFFVSDGMRDVSHKLLGSLGYKVQDSKNIKEKDGYLAGTREQRVSSFHQLLKDDGVGAIVHVRGGFGNAHILDALDYKEIKKQRKIIMGYSDVTALLLAIYTKTGLVTYHGPMPKTGISTIEARYIEDVLVKQSPITYNNPKGEKIRTIVPGVSEGILIGGNLSVICSLLGSQYLPDWRGKILFLEDIGEKHYKVDRMLAQLQAAGVLDQVSGIILGAFTSMSVLSSGSFSLDEIFKRYFARLKVPVFSGAKFGHITDQFILPVGAKAKIDSRNGMIQILSY